MLCDRLCPSSITSVASSTLLLSASNAHERQIQVVRTARIARHQGVSIGSGFAHKFAFVVKAGIAVRAQPKVEQFALLVTFFFGEVHEGNVRLRLVVGGSSRRRSRITSSRRGNIVVAPLNMRLGVIPVDVASLILRHRYSVFVTAIVITPGIFVIGIATPFTNGSCRRLHHLRSHRRRQVFSVRALQSG